MHNLLFPYFYGAAALVVIWSLIWIFGRPTDMARLYVGADGRPSTSKFQWFLWTAVTIFSYVSIYAARGASHFPPTPIADVPSGLLLAMGISTTTMVVAKGITVGYVNSGRVVQPPVSSQKGGVFLDDTGDVDLTKAQMLAWTFVAVAVYLIAVYHTVRAVLQHAADAGYTAQLPDIDTSLLVLMGIGHGAYLGKKLVLSTAPRLTSLIPSSGMIGNKLTLYGSCLGTGQDAGSQILLDGVAFVSNAEITDKTATFTIPLNRLDGSDWALGQTVQVSVAVNGQVSNALPFSILGLTSTTSARNAMPRSVVSDSGNGAANTVGVEVPPLTSLADQLDHAADRLSFTGDIAKAQPLRTAAAQIRSGMPLNDARDLTSGLLATATGKTSPNSSRLSFTAFGEYEPDPPPEEPNPTSSPGTHFEIIDGMRIEVPDGSHVEIQNGQITIVHDSAPTPPAPTPPAPTPPAPTPPAPTPPDPPEHAPQPPIPRPPTPTAPSPTTIDAPTGQHLSDVSVQVANAFAAMNVTYPSSLGLSNVLTPPPASLNRPIGSGSISDCSNFVKYVLNQAGLGSIPYTPTASIDGSSHYVEVPVEQARVGDLIVQMGPISGHMGIFTGEIKDGHPIGIQKGNHQVGPAPFGPGPWFPGTTFKFYRPKR